MSHEITKNTPIPLSIHELDCIAGGFGNSIGSVGQNISSVENPLDFKLAGQNGFPFGKKKQQENYQLETYENYEETYSE